MPPENPPPAPDPWAAAAVRIFALVNHGAEICEGFTCRDEVPVACERCGYTADVHLIRDLLHSAAAERQQHQAELTRAVLRYTVKGFTAGENTDAKAWRERAETAEACLAAERQQATAQQAAKDAEIERLKLAHAERRRLCELYFDNQVKAREAQEKAEAEVASLTAQQERLVEALNGIASWPEGPQVDGSFDEPESARRARAALSALTQRQIATLTGTST